MTNKFWQKMPNLCFCLVENVTMKVISGRHDSGSGFRQKCKWHMVSKCKGNSNRSGGPRGHTVHFFFIFMHFSAKVMLNRMLALPSGLGASSGKSWNHRHAHWVLGMSLRLKLQLHIATLMKGISIHSKGWGWGQGGERSNTHYCLNI